MVIEMKEALQREELRRGGRADIHIMYTFLKCPVISSNAEGATKQNSGEGYEGLARLVQQDD